MISTCNLKEARNKVKLNEFYVAEFFSFSFLFCWWSTEQNFGNHRKMWGNSFPFPLVEKVLSQTLLGFMGFTENIEIYSFSSNGLNHLFDNSSTLQCYFNLLLFESVL